MSFGNYNGINNWVILDSDFRIRHGDAYVYFQPLEADKEDLCEFDASLDWTVTARLAWDTE